MKKYFVILCLLTCCLTLVGCFPTNSPSFSITPTVLQMHPGDMETLTATGATSQVVWTSSDTAIATVFAGVVEAKAIGKAVITATVGNTNRTCEVFVTGSDGAGLRLSPYLVELSAGETAQFKVGNAYGVELAWKVADESVAKVSDDGTVTALKAGLTKVTLTSTLEEVEAYVAVKHHWGEYELVWSDEFNGTELDRSVWDFNIGGGGWGNQELQYYTNRTENVRVEGGNLVIEARKEPYENRNYTSGRILTRGYKEFLYGKFEARIKFPGGKGTWPAWWMMGGSMNWPACGEIDIQEHVGSQDTRVSFALHTPDKNGTKGNNWSKTHFFDYPMSADYHVYGVEWAQQEEGGKDVIRFFVDGVQYAEVWQTKFDDNASWPFQKPHYLILNLAIGGTMGGQVDDAIFDQERKMLVDWVRVYQRKEK